MTTFVWAEKRRFVVPAQLVGDVAVRIADTSGRCEAGDLVDEARPLDAPLHPAFDWDDEHAAEAYRREQARHMLRSIRIQVGDQVEEAPAFVRVFGTDESGGWSGYKLLPNLTVQEWSEADAEAFAALNSLRRRYAALHRFAGVWQEVDALSV